MKLQATTVPLALLLASPTYAMGFNMGGSNVKPQVDKVKDFQWQNPFTSETTAAFNSVCESTVDFAALEYTLHELTEPPPNGLKPWSRGLKNLFADTEYPGGWAGMDHHLLDRSLLLMNYNELPIPVREWIENQERTGGTNKGHFAVFEKPARENDSMEAAVKFPEADKIDRAQDENRVAIFAPGALYGILPLWAADASECKDELLDLSKYTSQPEDGNVVAWAYHIRPAENKMKFKVQVQSLRAKDAEKVEDTKKDETKDTNKSGRDEL